MEILFYPRPVSQMNTTTIDGEQFVEITNEAAEGIIPGAYMISESGRIYSNLTNKFIHGSISKDNYVLLNLRLANGKSKVFYLHRILAISYKYIANYKEMQIDHIDCDKTHNDLDNYDWVDLVENTNRARNNGLMVVGEDCSWAKLTEKEVREICEILQNHSYESLSSIARRYNCNRNMIRDIAVGNTWKHVSKNYDITYIPRKR